MEQKTIETELVKANITDQTISKMRSDYLPLTVKDVYDKPGYEAVRSARLEVKKYRVSVEKTMKIIREPAPAFQKDVIAKEKEIVSRLSEVEDHLTAQENIFTRKDEQVIIKTPEEEDWDKLAVLLKQLSSIKFPELSTEKAKIVSANARFKVEEAINLIK